MNQSQSRLPDAARSHLRSVVANVEQNLSMVSQHDLTEENRVAMQGLLISWNTLVETLNLGPEPAYRECPVCKHLGMHDATTCGYCWTTLTPLK
jgi:hypothetical protein